MYQFLIRHKMIIGSVIATLIIAVGAAYIFAGNGTPATTQVQRGDLQRTVAFSAEITPTDTAKLSFDTGGTLRHIGPDVGDTIQRGAVLARLETNSLQTQLAQARAELASQQARLKELERGATEEEIAVQREKIGQKKTNLADARRSLLTRIQSAYTQSDIAVRKVADQFIRDPESNNPSLYPRSSFYGDTARHNEFLSQRVRIGDALEAWNARIATDTPKANVSTQTTLAYENLRKVEGFLTLAARILKNAHATTDGASETTLNTWYNDVTNSRSTISGQLTKLANAEQAYNTARSALQIAESQMRQLKADATEEAVAQQKAQIEVSKARIDQYKTQIANRILQAPMRGTITQRHASLGESVAPNTPVYTMISTQQHEITGNVSELDVAELHEGDAAQVTLDAFGPHRVFDAHITSIDPAGTEINNVPAYGITLHFDDIPEDVRPGMTANVTVITEAQRDTLHLPVSSVATKNGTSTVYTVHGDGTVKPRSVETGMQSTDGRIQITDGVSEGTVILQDAQARE